MKKRFSAEFRLDGKQDGSLKKMFSSTENNLKKIGADIRKMNATRVKIGQFNTDGLNKARGTLREAKEDFRRLSEEMRQSGGANLKLQRQWNKSREAVDRASRRVDEQKRSLRGLRTELKEAGLDTRRLGEANDILGRKIESARMSQEKLKRSQSRSSKIRSAGGKARNVALGGALSGGALLRPLLGAHLDYQSGLNNVKALGQISKFELAETKKLTLDLGKTTKFTAVESISAVEMLRKNGLSIGSILGGALKETTLLSASTGAGLQESADLATDAMLIFGKKSKDLKEIVNSVNGVMINSKFGFQEYKEALAAGAPSARVAGQSLDEFNAVIASTASFFKSGSTAGTSYKVFMDRLTTGFADTEFASNKAGAAAEKLGVSFFDSAGNLKKFGVIADQLKDGLAGLTEQERIEALTALFGTRGKNFAVALASAGSEGIKHVSAQIKLADAEKQAAIRLDGAVGRREMFRSAFQERLRSLGETLEPMYLKLLKIGTKVLNKMDKINPVLIRTGVAMGAIVAAGAGMMAVLAPVALFLNQMHGLMPVMKNFSKIGTLAKPLLAVGRGLGAILSGISLPVVGAVSAVAVAVAAIGLAVRKYWEPIKAFFVGVGEGIKESLMPVLKEFKPVIDVMKSQMVILSSVFEASFGRIKVFAGDFKQAFLDLIEPVRLSAEQFAAIKESGKGIGKGLADQIKKPLSMLAKMLKMLKTVSEKFKEISQKAQTLNPLKSIRETFSGERSERVGSGRSNTRARQILKSQTGGASVMNDNSTAQITIQQNPGEDSKNLARRVAEEIQKMKGQTSLYDSEVQLGYA